MFLDGELDGLDLEVEPDQGEHHALQVLHQVVETPKAFISKLLVSSHFGVRSVADPVLAKFGFRALYPER